MKFSIIVSSLFLTGITYCGWADWPQWRGPNRDGISMEAGLLKAWPKDGPPLAWKIDSIGGGDSAPSVASGRIFGMGNRGEEEVVWARSETDGGEVWTTPLGPAFAQRPAQGREGPGCTPTVDGERLYVVGLAGNVACLQVEDGHVLWQISMTEEFGGQVPMWSYRESPLVEGDNVICTPGGPNATLVALNKFTGETVWRGELPGSPSATTAGDRGRAAPDSDGASSEASRPGPGGGNAGSASAAIVVTGTQDPALYTDERYGMSAFSCRLPNGNYLAKLHFAETYEGITGPRQRVFSFDVHGKEFNDFDIWVKAGGFRRAHVETVPVEVTNGEFRVTFTPKVENPAIKAIEILPQGDTASSAEPIRIKAGVSTSLTDSSGQEWQPDQGFEGGNVSRGGGFAAMGGFGGGSGATRGGRGGGRGGPRAAYSSVVAIDFEGQRQVVQLISDALVGFAASDGRFLWRYAAPANRMGINCATPLFHDGMVFASTAYGGGAGLVRLSKDTDGGVRAEEVYATPDFQNHHGGFVLYDGNLYGATGGNEGGALVCLDFNTGNIQWDRRETEGRRAKGSLALADGRLYYRMENGTILLVEPNETEYIEHGRFEQPDRTRQPAWAHPVVANGKLYIRDQETLFCYDIKAK